MSHHWLQFFYFTVLMAGYRISLDICVVPQNQCYFTRENPCKCWATSKEVKIVSNKKFHLTNSFPWLFPFPAPSKLIKGKKTWKLNEAVLIAYRQKQHYKQNISKSFLKIICSNGTKIRTNFLGWNRTPEICVPCVYLSYISPLIPLWNQSRRLMTRFS